MSLEKVFPKPIQIFTARAGSRWEYGVAGSGYGIFWERLEEFSQAPVNYRLRSTAASARRLFGEHVEELRDWRETIPGYNHRFFLDLRKWDRTLTRSANRQQQNLHTHIDSIPFIVWPLSWLVRRRAWFTRPFPFARRRGGTYGDCIGFRLPKGEEGLLMAAHPHTEEYEKYYGRTAEGYGLIDTRLGRPSCP